MLRAQDFVKAWLCRTEDEVIWDTLRRHLLFDPARDVKLIRKYNVHIGQGQEIHVGDRIYQRPDAETLGQVVRRLGLEIDM